MEKIDIENWKDIPGYEGKYQVSDLGNVRSLNYGQTGEVKVMKPADNGSGYLFVQLCKNGKPKAFTVHSLVITTFKGPIPPGMQVNHKNEDKSDNRLENLEVVTAKQNINWGTHNERVAKALKGKPSWNKGIPHTKAARAKMSAARKGKSSWNKGIPHSEETRAKISAANKGKKYTEESKTKMSLARKGKPSPNKGKKISEETRAKMAAAAKAYWERKRKSLLR